MRNTKNRPEEKLCSLKKLQFTNLGIHHYEGSLGQFPDKLLTRQKITVGVFLVRGGSLLLGFGKKKQQSELINNRFLLLNSPGNITITYKNNPEERNHIIEVFFIVFNSSFLLGIVPANVLPVFDEFRTAILHKTMGVLPVAPGLLSGEMKVLLFDFFNNLPKFKLLEEGFATAKAMILFTCILEEVLSCSEGRLAVTTKEELLARRTMELLSHKKNAHEFTIIRLAEKLGTNETTLKQSFKKTYGTTIFKHFMRQRMAEAEQLLAEGKKVGEVSILMGYSNISHFSHAYSKFYHTRPGKIRR